MRALPPAALRAILTEWEPAGEWPVAGTAGKKTVMPIQVPDKAEPEKQQKGQDDASGLGDKLKALSLSAAERPHDFLEIVLVVVLLFSFVAVAYAWISEFLPGPAPQTSGYEGSVVGRVKVPLVVFGATIMALLVLSSARGAAVLIAVLIIGTIVAQEGFLLRIAHMFSGTRQPYNT